MYSRKLVFNLSTGYIVSSVREWETEEQALDRCRGEHGNNLVALDENDARERDFWTFRNTLKILPSSERKRFADNPYPRDRE